MDGNRVILGGADVVDGSPVLDIKPYIPFCEALPDAVAPSWVAAEAADEPLKVSDVRVSPAAAEAIAACWRRQRSRSLYASADEFTGLVVQALSRDIRSAYQRLTNAGAKAATPDDNGAAAAASGSGNAGGKASQVQADAAKGFYHIVLEGIDVSYDVDEARVVQVRGATMNVVGDNKWSRSAGICYE